MATVRPGDIAVVRAPREEDAAGEATVPVRILVAGGRAVVSSSRLLLRVATAWAESFAAPEYLLQPAFLEALQRDVARAMDADVRLRHWRVFVPGPGAEARVIDASDRALVRAVLSIHDEVVDAAAHGDLDKPRPEMKRRQQSGNHFAGVDSFGYNSSWFHNRGSIADAGSVT